MKLSLNREALERLLGGDTQLEVELRHQVVEEFSKRHLKDVVDSTAYAKVLNEVQKVITDEIKKSVGEQTYNSVWGGLSKAAPTVKEIVEREVHSQIKKVVQETIQETAEIQRDTWFTYINQKVQALFDREISHLVQNEFKKKLEALK